MRATSLKHSSDLSVSAQDRMTAQDDTWVTERLSQPKPTPYLYGEVGRWLNKRLEMQYDRDGSLLKRLTTRKVFCEAKLKEAE